MSYVIDAMAYLVSQVLSSVTTGSTLVAAHPSLPVLLTALLTSAAGVSAGVILMYLWACGRRAQLRHGPSRGPMAWPVLGAQLEAVRNYHRLLDWITGFFDHDHHTITMRTFRRTSKITVDPANIEYILKTNFSNFPKGGDMHFKLFDMLGNGILNTDGELWKSHRKLASLEFSVKKLKKLSSTVYIANALKLVNVLASKASQGVDMQELLLAMTFDSICQVVLGEEFDTLSGPPDSPYSAVARAMDTAQEMITRRYTFPWWRILRYFDAGSEKILKKELSILKQFLADIIKKKRVQLIDRAAILKSTASILGAAASDRVDGDQCAQVVGDRIVDAPDLLSRFIIQIAKEDTRADIYSGRQSCNAVLHVENGSESKLREQLEEVRDAMMSFVLAGTDTTGSTLSWFLYCMCSHPDKQEKVFQELLELEKFRPLKTNEITCNLDIAGIHHEQGHFITKPSTTTFTQYAELMTYDNLQAKMPYLHAAIAETLRLYPAVPRDGKTTLRDDVLPDGTVLKAGDSVGYSPYSMGRMPFLWGEDALEFKPERWLHHDDDGNSLVRPESPFKFTAFQAGPRMCLGKDAAYLQIKITAALLLRFFRFELVPGHPVTYKMMVVMSMKHGLKVNFSPRSESTEG